MQFKKKIFNFGQFFRFLWHFENHAQYMFQVQSIIFFYRKYFVEKRYAILRDRVKKLYPMENKVANCIEFATFW